MRLRSPRRRGLGPSLTATAAVLLLSACGTGSAQVSATGRSNARSGVSSTADTPSQPAASVAVPRFAHIVVAVLENHSYSQIVSSAEAPFLTGLAHNGAVLTHSYAVTHPSEPNYLALFSGSTQGLTNDSCPHTFSGPNLGVALQRAQLSFTGYSESLPNVGFTGCSAGPYARKHNPWVEFPALPASVNQPFTAFPSDYTTLPTVSFVIPNLNHDMHDGTIAAGDAWMRQNLGGYVAWARTHNSLLIVTADEDDTGHGNRIATILAGAHVLAGPSAQPVNHYGVLRTILTSVGVSPFGAAAGVPPLTGIWN